MGTTNYPYIFDIETLQGLNIVSVLEALGCDSKGDKVFCPSDHSKPQPLKIFTDSNSCHCHNCKLLGDGKPITIVKHLLSVGFVDACRWLNDAFNVAEIPNPEYVGEATCRKTKRPAAEFTAVPKVKRQIDYLRFDPKHKYTKVDFKKFHSQYGNMTDAQKLMMVYTAIFRLAQGTEQKAKYGYYSDRGITPTDRMEQIAYLSTKDFETLTKILKEQFPKEDLVAFGIIHDDSAKTPGEFKLNYVTKGGLLLVPSYDLYTDMVTGFMARPTHPPKWMKDKKMKEIQISQTHIIKPLPFGLTHEMLKSNTPFVFATEGHPDGLALPKTIAVHDRVYLVFVISTPGTHGYTDEMLGLLKGKALLLAYDQDEAGRKGAIGSLTLQSEEGSKVFPDDERGNMALEIDKRRLTLNQKKFSVIETDGLVQRLRKADVKGYALEWDERMGGDVNDLEINGNLEAVIEEIVIPLIQDIL